MSLHLGLSDVLLFIRLRLRASGNNTTEASACSVIILGEDDVNVSYTNDATFIILSGIFQVFPV